MTVSDAGLGAVAREDVLRSLLSSCPDVIVFALSSAAVRVPLPEDPLFAGVSTLPGSAATAVDVVLPVDRMEVVRIWESAQSTGLGQGRVRPAAAPEQVLTLTIVDLRDRYGALFGLLAPDPDVDMPSRHSPVTADPSLLVPGRPRTATVHKNLNAVITDMDARVTAMLGWGREEMLGHRSLEFIHPDDHERAIAQWLEMRSRRESERVRVRHALRDGGWLWVEVENTFVGLDHPEDLVAVAHLTDISDEMAAHEAVRHREALFRRLADSLPVGVFQWTAEGTLSYLNARLKDMLGITDPPSHGAASPVPPHHLVNEPAGLVGVPAGGLSLDRLLAPLAESDRAAVLAALSAAAVEGTDAELEVGAVFPGPASHGPAASDVAHSPTDGNAAADARGTYHRRRYLFTVAALSDYEGTPGAIVSVTDVTSSAHARDEFRVRATYDPLTGCLNRDAMVSSLQTLLDSSAGPDDQVALLYVDLDSFKNVNDTHGHAAGDRVLQTAAERLLRLTRKTDLVGRLGGDEFLVALTEVGSPDDVRELAQRLHAGLQGPVELNGATVQLAASIGVSLARPGTDVAEAMNAADRAMYRAKRERSGVVLAED
jgi:diguanylate cyclase (GGDEF)-like protein/PAS domain S-box-containing protein